MGVFKLWELLLTIAQPCPIENLEGKVLAIDASIWIVRIDTSLSSNTDKIKSILNKIMLLKRHNILPIFVFDGTPPALKRRTLEERARRRVVADDLDAKKKSEIELVRIIEGDTSNRLSEKAKRIQQNECELEVIDEQLKKLSQLPAELNDQISSEHFQKIAMQSQILNTKYKIMLELTPQYTNYPYFIPPQEYQDLDIDLKIQYLDELSEYKWKHLKATRRLRKREQMTEEQKLKHDLEVIEKKSIIRQMQDNLFRKMMQKHVKVQNGYEIVETIYNGKNVVQKRKIKEKDGDRFGMGRMRKDKMKNDMSRINFGGQKESQSEEEEDPFISSFCNHSIATSKSQNSLYSTQQASESIQNTSSLAKESASSTRLFKKDNLNFKQPKQAKPRNKDKNNKLSQSNNEESQPYIPFQSENNRNQEQPEIFVNAEQFKRTYTHNKPQSLNRDNLPNFNSDQHPSYLNSSNDNVELQNLFTILGLPFLVAPGQAEAQCAALEQQDIVDGIVTEDSDTFLFGGKNVYRGVFGNNIRWYSFERMQQKLKLTRQKLIIFAQLLGSDYTEGVKGVGLVNAMQILKVFNTFDKLEKFKKWAEHPDVLLPQEQTTAELLKLATKEERQFYQLHKKFKNYWYVNPSFGNKTIHYAYLRPDVLRPDQLKSMKEALFFEEKPCKQELLSRLLKDRLQLQEKEYDHYTKLLSRRYNSKRPNTLLNYFSRKAEDEGELARIKSKRLQKSINELKQDDDV